MFSTLLSIAVLATAISGRACPAPARSAPAKAAGVSASYKPPAAVVSASSAYMPAPVSSKVAVISAGRPSASVAASIAAPKSSAAASAPPLGGSKAQQGGKYPFDNLVAYGDELSDNGNGSFAHGLTGHNNNGEPDRVYGFGTWTNGPVAVSYLNDLLGLGSNGLNDYAFGGCCGGGSIGATLDNAYTKSDGGAQSLVEQIANYTGHDSNANIKSSLQFIWMGENDVSKHTDAFWLGDPKNNQFATDYSTKVAASVKTLLDAGAPYIFVSNIYPKQIAPVTPKYLCGAPDNDCVKTWAQVITAANSALQSSLAQFGDKVIHYDSFSFISNLATNAASNGFTRPIGDICDGAGDAAWTDCITNNNVDKYFWLNFIQPTTRVHQLIAADMKKAIDKHFGL